MTFQMETTNLSINFSSIMTHASVPSDVREHLQITDNLIRLSVGLEAAEDLISDLNEALTATLPL